MSMPQDDASGSSDVVLAPVPSESWAPPKPLLNPIQNDGPAPSSTIVEPPRSPNFNNPATNDRGNNHDVPSGDSSIASPGVPPAAMMTAGGASSSFRFEPPSLPIGPAESSLRTTVDESLPNGSAEPPYATAEGFEDPSLPPLPTDAPLPPSPPAPIDEDPPTLPPDAIPPAVATPTRISMSDDVMDVEAPSAPSLPSDLPPPINEPSSGDVDPNPLVQGFAVPSLVPEPTETSIASAPTPGPPAPPAEPRSEPMDVDADGEEETIVLPSSISPDAQTNGLKRSGDDLAGPEEKRSREDVPVTEAAAPAPASDENASVPPPTPSGPLAPVSTPAPPTNIVPINYDPPPVEPAGSTAPITLTQHKHLLSTIRSLKKNKDALAFLAPVDAIALGIPQYFNVIAKPMDFSTVETKLVVSDPRGPPKDKSKMGKWDDSKGNYGSVSDVVMDVRQVWWNTRRFNGPDHFVSQAAGRLEGQFDKAIAHFPPEPAPMIPPSPVAGPSSGHRPSMSGGTPPLRRTSEGPDGRPKREIHAPASRDIGFEHSRKPKRRNDPQLQFAARVIKSLETGRTFDTTSHFLYPVSQIIQELPDYSSIIKKPMDLNIIKEKLNDGDYDDVAHLNADFKVMTANAMKYNPPGHPVHDAAKQFQQLWEEKMLSLPPKVEARDTSEDPLAEEFEEASDDEEAKALQSQIRRLKKQRADIDTEITSAEDKLTRIQSKPRKTKTPKAPSRKSSMVQSRPNANGIAKKPRKSKEMRADGDSGDEVTELTHTQKQELADKIGQSDPEVLAKAIDIIRSSGQIGDVSGLTRGENQANEQENGEIELDIDALPSVTQIKLYSLVCRPLGKRARGSLSGAPGKKRPATGGHGRKRIDQDAENARIQRMEAQLQNFQNAGGAGGYQDDSESSEEDFSDEE